MDITVVREDIRFTHITGGEHATCNVEISVDTSLILPEQRELVIHAVIENYCCSWNHDAVNELAELIEEALEQLEKIQNEASDRPE